MVLYTIMRYKGKYSKDVIIERRKRLPAASQMFYDLVYDMCKAEALLDRPIAHQLTKEVLAWEHKRRSDKSRTDGKLVLRVREDDPHTCVVINWEYQ